VGSAGQKKPMVSAWGGLCHAKFGNQLIFSARIRETFPGLRAI
jgi:hypothetical protein